MARTAIAVQTIPKNSVLDDITFSAADAVNNHSWINSGKEILLMKSTNGALTAVISSVTDEHGRTGDITLTPGAGDTSAAGPLEPAIWNQRAAADLGKVFMGLSDSTNITFAVVKFQ